MVEILATLEVFCLCIFLASATELARRFQHGNLNQENEKKLFKSFNDVIVIHFGSVANIGFLQVLWFPPTENVDRAGWD